MSPSTSRFLATCTAANSDALVTSCRKAKTLSRRPTSADYFRPFCVHDTAATFNANDRPKIALYFLLFCRFIANGEIFNFDGGFCFMSYNLSMVANPSDDFPRASTWISEITSSSNADEWGSLIMLTTINPESSRLQPRQGIRPVHISVINLSLGVASLSILEIRDLVTFHR